MTGDTRIDWCVDAFFSDVPRPGEQLVEVDTTIRPLTGQALADAKRLRDLYSAAQAACQGAPQTPAPEHGADHVSAIS